MSYKAIEAPDFKGRSSRKSYRDLLINLVKSDIKVRYQGSWLGIFWSLLNPAAQIALYIFVFSIVFRSGLENYPLFLVSGLIHHIMFSQALSQGAEAYVGSTGLLGKINFPRFLVPLATFFTNVYFWLISYVIFLIAFPLIGGVFSWELLYAIPVSLLFLVFVVSCMTVVAVLTVEFRDLKHLVEIITMFLFWLTPIPYSLDMVPKQAAEWLFYNPLTWYIEAFHAVFYYQEVPSQKLWLGMVGISLGLSLLAVWIYKMKKDYLVERL